MNNLLTLLTEIVERDLEHVENLNTLLSTEKECLTQRTYNQLKDIAESKQNLINLIEQNNQQKIELIKKYLSEDSGESIMKALVTEYGVKPVAEFKALNQALEDKLEKCRHENAVNGQVIVRTLENNQELIDIITGKSNQDNLYNAMGKVSNQTPSNPINQKV